MCSSDLDPQPFEPPSQRPPRHPRAPLATVVPVHRNNPGWTGETVASGGRPDQTTTRPPRYNGWLSCRASALESVGVDLNAVRTFVAAADAGQFQQAAAELSISQQAVSKRIAALERDLGVQLFTRTPRGARLTIDGQAFLPHARDLLGAAERAAASVRPGRRALRVDVIGRGLAPAALLRDFHRAHPDIALDDE